MKIVIVSILGLLAVCVVFILWYCLVMGKRADEEVEHYFPSDVRKEIEKGR